MSLQRAGVAGVGGQWPAGILNRDGWFIARNPLLAGRPYSSRRTLVAAWCQTGLPTGVRYNGLVLLEWAVNGLPGSSTVTMGSPPGIRNSPYSVAVAGERW